MPIFSHKYNNPAGTGLGLSIVKHAVQYHHGKIEIDIKVGEGTTISIIFDN